ncbi:MAG: ORF6N domain-containing protein [Candidatus Scalindua rubra]|uniref:ORF6N domain protein n=1 Tax=Candidatus Scalindua brodae TaxID=237368 RepID=A0A0B0EG69_9BACT|nr:MAG: ORF6N domain protein [Candidatus Scalindua brodae]MBZ0109698.1 ORF6N domain-containing protein [Candidatus Scalindua rubra]TWU32431.1 ORF6N domain protein [Candidatus Brocadiaceae bacterium S225]
MNLIKFEEVESKIIEIRGQKVILDSEVAELYGVATRDINKAVKNNQEKFPVGYIIELSKDEKKQLVENFHRFDNLKHSSVNPKAFTEKGLYMIATILKSERATQTTIAIVETFAKIKNLTRNIKELSNVRDEQKKQNLLQKSGEIIAEIFEDDLVANESETTIEMNFAVLKFKHTIKKSKQNK